MKTAIIVNKDSGSYFDNADEIKGYFTDAFKKNGLAPDDVEMHVVAGKDIEKEIHNLVKGGIPALVACGGDGTVSTAARYIAGTETILGVLPMGTFNNFGGDIGVSKSSEFAAETVARGHVTEIDTAEINGRLFINNSTIGLFAHTISLEKKSGLRMGIGKVFNLVLALFKVFRFFPLYKIHVKSDNCEDEPVTPFLFVGNNRFDLNLLGIGSRKRLDEGVLCLYFAKCKTRLCIIRLVFEAIFNKLRQSEDFVVRHLKNLEIRTRKKKLKIMVDGEILRIRPPVTLKINERNLKVFTPE